MLPKADPLHAVLGPYPDAHVHACRVYGYEHELVDVIWGGGPQQALEILSKHVVQDLCTAA